MRRDGWLQEPLEKLQQCRGIRMLPLKSFKTKCWEDQCRLLSHRQDSIGMHVCSSTCGSLTRHKMLELGGNEPTILTERFWPCPTYEVRSRRSRPGMAMGKAGFLVKRIRPEVRTAARHCEQPMVDCDAIPLQWTAWSSLRSSSPREDDQWDPSWKLRKKS